MNWGQNWGQININLPRTLANVGKTQNELQVVAKPAVLTKSITSGKQGPS